MSASEVVDRIKVLFIFCVSLSCISLFFISFNGFLQLVALILFLLFLVVGLALMALYFYLKKQLPTPETGDEKVKIQRLYLPRVEDDKIIWLKNCEVVYKYSYYDQKWNFDRIEKIL